MGSMELGALILFGGVVGLIGYLTDRTQTRGGLAGAVLFGIFGAMGGGVAATLLFGSTFSHLEFSSVLLAFAGSLFLLVLQHTVFSKQERF
jgi:uncharacterized membrane protein YeaQ/YmgE (transglycosylase-associated protein family)